MTIRTVFVAFLLFALATTGFGQSRDADSQTTREILAEIRGIHEDIRITQSTQILLTEFEMQQSVVNRATESVDSARAKLLDIQRDQKLVTGDLERAEDHLNQASDAEDRKHTAEEIERHKANIAALKIEERGRTTTLQEMGQRLQNAQVRMEEIENELNTIISRLRPNGK